MSLHLTRPPEPRLSIRELPMQARALWRAMVAARRERLEASAARAAALRKQREREDREYGCLASSIRISTGNHGRPKPR